MLRQYILDEFYVNRVLRQYILDEFYVISIDSIELGLDLTYEEKPVPILQR